MYVRRWGIILIFISTVISILGFQNCGNGFISSTDSSGSHQAPVANQVPIANLDSIGSICPEAEYAQFLCLNKTLTSQEGLAYNMTFRWNRANKESQGTILWVLGGDGRGKWRTDYKDAAVIQDNFDANRSIRSVEVEFVDAPANADSSGGYWKYPQGYYSAASAYLAALKFVSTQLKKGNFLNHVGGSNGTMVTAYALSRFNAGAYLNRAILHAGPFLSDIADACDGSHFASFSVSPNQYSTILSLIGLWGFGDKNYNPCNTVPNDRLSVLRNGAVAYPNLGIHVAMGKLEETAGFGPWILESNLQWYSKIQAAEKTRVISQTLGHEMNWGEVREYAALPPPRTMGAAPILKFSLSEGGAAITSASLNATVYGVVSNVDSSSAMACMTESSNAAFCDNPHNWTAMPNGEWSYSNGQWRSAFVPAKIGAASGKTYIAFFINTKTGQRSESLRLSITAGP